ncbi:hypothetical protein CBS101457_006879 [Exobasidium rhododendri]|nr:hypothetical protein CBS101457_006879 [Exobasidium rhododendri]
MDPRSHAMVPYEQYGADQQMVCHGGSCGNRQMNNRPNYDSDQVSVSSSRSGRRKKKGSSSSRRSEYSDTSSYFSDMPPYQGGHQGGNQGMPMVPYQHPMGMNPQGGHPGYPQQYGGNQMMPYGGNQMMPYGGNQMMQYGGNSAMGGGNQMMQYGNSNMGGGNQMMMPSGNGMMGGGPMVMMAGGPGQNANLIVGSRNQLPAGMVGDGRRIDITDQIPQLMQRAGMGGLPAPRGKTWLVHAGTIMVPEGTDPTAIGGGVQRQITQGDSGTSEVQDAQYWEAQKERANRLGQPSKSMFGAVKKMFGIGSSHRCNH